MSASATPTSPATGQAGYSRGRAPRVGPVRVPPSHDASDHREAMSQQSNGTPSDRGPDAARAETSAEAADQEHGRAEAMARASASASQANGAAGSTGGRGAA